MRNVKIGMDSFMMGWHGRGNKFGLAERRLQSFSGAGPTKLALRALQGHPIAFNDRRNTTSSCVVKSVSGVQSFPSQRFNLMVKPDIIEERDQLIPESAKVILVPALKFGAVTGQLLRCECTVKSAPSPLCMHIFFVNVKMPLLGINLVSLGRVI